MYGADQIRSAVKDALFCADQIRSALKDGMYCVDQITSALKDVDQIRSAVKDALFCVDQIRSALKDGMYCVDQITSALKDVDQIRSAVKDALFCVDQIRSALKDGILTKKTNSPSQISKFFSNAKKKKRLPSCGGTLDAASPAFNPNNLGSNGSDGSPIVSATPLAEYTELSRSQEDFFRNLDQKVQNGEDYDSDAASEDFHKRLASAKEEWERFLRSRPNTTGQTGGPLNSPSGAAEGNPALLFPPEEERPSSRSGSISSRGSQSRKNSLVLQERRGSAVRGLLLKQDAWDALPQELALSQDDPLPNPRSLEPHREEDAAEDGSSPRLPDSSPTLDVALTVASVNSSPVNKVNKKAVNGASNKRRSSYPNKRSSPPKQVRTTRRIPANV
ncbi:unnamed protein product [Cyprideis torosa]|uniref:Uncharacterized protein n=1 Tax=Cyprideis torosa TaxID=163714 RepID=A0A7R8WCK6_9CRUS|nr:unnamed protein product [Cyprideis torosa]CAG0887607.1 unnamed protein product [Cyprideis torosa]